MADGNPLKRAPRRDVSSVSRVGEWGKISYHHILTCGHLEARRRMTRVGGQMACPQCLSVAAIRARPRLGGDEVGAQYDETVALSIALEANIRAVVSSRLSVPAESIDVVVGPTGTAKVTMFLDASEATTLSRT